MNCPSCGNELEDDFGLVTCSVCGHSVFINMDGEIDSEQSQIIQAQQANEPADLATELFSEIEEANSTFEESQSYEEDSHREEQAIEEPISEESMGESIQDDDETQYEDGFDAPAEVTQTQSAELSDIAAFGNSEAATGEEGVIFYNMTFSGIDSDKIRNDFIEAISDSKLLLNVDRIVSDIKDGQVKISDISALKASVILNSLHSLPIRVKWEQYSVLA